MHSIGQNVSGLVNALQHSQTLNPADIIAGLVAEDRSNGARIGCAVEAARLAAITSALL